MLGLLLSHEHENRTAETGSPHREHISRASRVSPM